MAIFEMDAMGQTDIIGTCRKEPSLDPMVAKVALLGHLFFLIEINGVVGTCIDTTSATGADSFIQHDDAIASFFDGVFRARIPTRRVIAVPASVDTIDIFPFAIDHSGPVLADGNIFHPLRCVVFLFARNFTGLAPPA
jgi:hypothetical protein